MRLTRRMLVPLVLAVLFANCGPIPPPNPPVHRVTVACVVSDVDGGARLDSATCMLSAPNFPSATGTTNAQGYYPFNNVPLGTNGKTDATLDVSKQGYLPVHGVYAIFGNTDLTVSLASAGPPPLPTPPTRDEILSAAENMQGLTLTCADYPNGFPYYEAPFTSLSPDCRQALYAAKRAVGSKAIGIAISWNYCGQSYGFCYPVPGRDLAYDLGTLRDLMTEAIREGFVIDLKLAGDGMSANSNPGPGQYNDPVGWTYGYEWLMQNTARIVAGLQQAPDLTRYTVLVPGYDGVVPGWPEASYKYPGKLDNWLLLTRGLCADCYIGVELSAGYAHWGGESGNYENPAGQALDQIQQEFNTGPYETGDMDQVWQIAARHLGPAYTRGPGQPASDDPGAPFSATSAQFYLRNGTPRGKYYVKAFEPDTYLWVRNRISAADVQRDRAYLKARGYQVVD